MKLLLTSTKAGPVVVLIAAISLADSDEKLGRNQLFVELLAAAGSADGSLTH